MGPFETRLIPTGHPDHVLALHRSLDVNLPDSSSRLAPEVAGLLANAPRQGLSTDLLFGAYRGGRLAGACLAVESPGRAALVFAPGGQTASIALEGTVAALKALQAAAEERSIVLLEALVDPRSTDVASPLEQAGYRRLTRLKYLSRRAGAKTASGRADHALSWRSFTSELEPLFCEALERTYAQSLDCPELTGLRSTAEVLSGHKATGIFDPCQWWVVMRGGEAVGVLLLSRTFHEPALEIVYVGVAQPARGTGVADALLERAVTSAGQINASFLTLAVDERNTPALKMYGRWGFAPTAARDAWIVTPLDA